jgi:hypothetical protein
VRLIRPAKAGRIFLCRHAMPRKARVRIQKTVRAKNIFSYVIF